MIVTRRNLVSMKDLQGLDVRTDPKRLGRWSASIPYADLVEGILQTLENAEWIVHAQTLTLSRDRSRLCGGFRIAKHNQPGLPTGLAWGLGFTANYTGRERLFLYCGIWDSQDPVVCDALQSPKITVNFDPSRTFKRLFDELAGRMGYYSLMLRAMRDHKISDDTAFGILKTCTESRNLSWKVLGKVYAQWKGIPNRSALTLLNLFAKANAKSPPERQMGRGLFAFQRVSHALEGRWQAEGHPA